MYATLMVPTLDDNTTELSEYFKVVITSTDQPSVVEIGSPNMTIVTIEDNDPGSIHILTDAIHLMYIGRKPTTSCNVTQNVQLLINYLFAAVQVSFAQQTYTITEGGIVNITLVTSISFEFDFNVTLQYMDGSATGELLVNLTIMMYVYITPCSSFLKFSCHVSCVSNNSMNHMNVLSLHSLLCLTLDSSHWLHTWSIHCELQCWPTVSHLDGVNYWRWHSRAVRVLYHDDYLCGQTRRCCYWLTQRIGHHYWG